MPNGISDPYQMDESITNLRVVRCMSQFHFNLKKFILYANRAEPNQTPRSVVPDRSLYCLPMSKKDIRLQCLITV